MRNPLSVAAGVMLIAAAALSALAAITVGRGFTGGCQSGPLELDELLPSDAVVGVTRHDAFADRPDLRIWAPGSVAEATAVWGAAGDRDGLTSSGGRFNVIPEGEDRCATQRVGSSRYEIVYRDGDGPHLLATVAGAEDEARLTNRFGPPVEDPVGGTDRMVALAALWAGPAATIAVVVIMVAVGKALLDRRRSAIER